MKLYKVFTKTEKLKLREISIMIKEQRELFNI